MEFQQQTDSEIESYLREISEVKSDPISKYHDRAKYAFEKYPLFDFGITIFPTVFLIIVFPTFFEFHPEYSLQLFFASWLTIQFVIIPRIPLYFPTRQNISDIVDDIVNVMQIFRGIKAQLKHSIDSFRRLTHASHDQSGVNAAQIIEISDSIQSISSGIQRIEAFLMNFPEKLQSYRKKSKPLNDTVFQSVYRHYDEIIKKFLDSQKLWLSQIAPEIMNDIQTFLSQHVEELKTLDMEIGTLSESITNTANQGALELQKARLEGHIEQLHTQRKLDPKIEKLIQAIGSKYMDHLAGKGSTSDVSQIRLFVLYCIPFLLFLTALIGFEYLHDSGFVEFLTPIFTIGIVASLLFFRTRIKRSGLQLDQQFQNISNGIIKWMRDTENTRHELKEFFDRFEKLSKSDSLDVTNHEADLNKTADSIALIAQRIEQLNLRLNHWETDLEEYLIRSDAVSAKKIRRALQYHEQTMKKYLALRKNWLQEHILIFIEDIRAFLKYHSEALSVLSQKSGEQKSSAEIENQGALELQKAHIEAHIENLEKIRIRA